MPLPLDDIADMMLCYYLLLRHCCRYRCHCSPVITTYATCYADVIAAFDDFATPPPYAADYCLYSSCRRLRVSLPPYVISPPITPPLLSCRGFSRFSSLLLIFRRCQIAIPYAISLLLFRRYAIIFSFTCRLLFSPPPRFSSLSFVAAAARQFSMFAAMLIDAAFLRLLRLFSPP